MFDVCIVSFFIFLGINMRLMISKKPILFIVENVNFFLAVTFYSFF